MYLRIVDWFLLLVLDIIPFDFKSIGALPVSFISLILEEGSEQNAHG